MTTSQRPTCSTCAAWHMTGRCQLHPPVMIETRHGLVRAWPETVATDWCLDHVAGKEA